ncbi:MAG: DUF3413 domain-containing protein, partial [gamma proteobacterium symbiont of Bathyaustriella thionipta]|nr:DUF3413 domain-containing protein [gamma proteobacterium symbiont of Bathyaustriella thionipta]
MMFFSSQKINSTLYFLCTWLFSLYLCSGFLNDSADHNWTEQIHRVMLISTYALIYQLPAIVCYALLQRWLKTALFCAVVLSASGHVFVFLDSRLYDLYAFHINAFVWNLLTTPGG